MRIAIAELESISPYSQSRYHATEKLQRSTGAITESHRDYEARTWRERVHADSKGNVIIPPMAFKNCLSEIAKYLGVQIPGKGKATYTKHFEAGIAVVDPLVLPVKKAAVEGEWFFVPSDGKRGGSKRVEKCFPVVREWSGRVQFHVLDDVITPDVFERHLKEAGSFIGIGRFRPRNNGYYGRFAVKKITWKNVVQ